MVHGRHVDQRVILDLPPSRNDDVATAYIEHLPEQQVPFELISNTLD